MNQKYKRLLFWGVPIVILLSIVLWLQGTPSIHEVDYSEFWSDLETGKISEIVLRKHQYTYKRQTVAGSEEVQTVGVEPDHVRALRTGLSR